MSNNTTTTLEVTAVNTEYLNTRLHDLGISDEQNIFTRVWNQTSSGVGDDGKIVTTTNEQKREYKIFEADEEGNIVIHYFNLMGQPYSWKKKDTKWPRDFVRKRLRVPRGDQKYNQEEGSGQYPFFTPGLISKYKQNKDSANIDATPVAPVDILFIVEGEFKAFKGYMAGLDIIGILGIHGFYNGDVRGKLHDDVQDVIITCKVRKVVFLADADLLTVKWEEKKDLAKRGESFYTAVKLFRESLQLLLDDETIELSHVYYMHLKTKFTNEAKGLDDLLCKYSAVTEDIVHDLKSLQYAKIYFSGTPITDSHKDLQYLRRYMGLTDEQEFYKIYGEFIGSREFLYHNKRFEYNSEKREVVFV